MDGIIIINKEKNFTSHDVVYKIKKIFNEKVGHTGTLDPNATGVLPILIGKGTGLSKYLINHNKKYIATIKLGLKTETADVEGKIIEQKKVDIKKLNEENIYQIFQSLVGKQIQRPPIYSAIKVNGKKLYEYARAGKSIEVPNREIEIYDLKLIDIDLTQNTLKFEVFCSKGTYIRSLCETISEKLCTVGYMLDLQRTMVGDFYIDNSISINDLQDNKDNKDFLQKNIITIEKFFENKAKIVLNSHKLKLFLNGVLLDYKQNDDIVKVYSQDNIFIGIASVNNGKIKREIII